MKYLILIISIFTLYSCQKEKDKYRIIGIDVKISTYKQGPNNQCVDLSDSLKLDTLKLVVIKFNFIKEYYSDENSQIDFIMASNEFTCKEKISNIIFEHDGKPIDTELIKGDTSITGFFPRPRKSGSCQPNNCDCWSAFGYSNINQLIEEFNSNNIYTGYQCQGCNDDLDPFIFLIDPKDLKLNKELKLAVKITMDDNSEFSTTTNKLNR